MFVLEKFLVVRQFPLFNFRERLDSNLNFQFEIIDFQRILKSCEWV